MPQKEFGSIYVALCPLCLTRLTVGWDADQDVVPDIPVDEPRIRAVLMQRNPSFVIALAGQQKHIKGESDANRFIRGPLNCGCPNAVTLSVEPAHGRAVVSWNTAEPVTGNINHHPSAEKA